MQQCFGNSVQPPEDVYVELLGSKYSEIRHHVPHRA